MENINIVKKNIKVGDVVIPTEQEFKVHSGFIGSGDTHKYTEAVGVTRHTRFILPNGFTISTICVVQDNGTSDGRVGSYYATIQDHNYEVAILKDGEIVYELVYKNEDGEVEDIGDIHAYITKEEVKELIRKVNSLTNTKEV